MSNSHPIRATSLTQAHEASRESVLALTDMPDWMSGAVCASTDYEIFFPEKGQSTLPAKRICRTCPVTAECLEYALTHGERFGIWGALSERERRRLTGRRVS